MSEPLATDHTTATDPPEVGQTAVCVVNYGTPGLTLDCLASVELEVRRQRGLRAVVIDNASRDDSADQIERAVDVRGWKSWLTLARLDQNRGFAGGYNAAIEACRSAGDFDVVVLLNSDTLVREGAIQALTETLASDAGLGLVGPKLEWPDGTAQASCFRFLSPLTEFVTAASTGPITRLFPNHEVPVHAPQASADWDWISFACVAVRREVLDNVGLLDDQFFMYFEDVDYCRRVHSGGWRIGFQPKARVVHLRGSASRDAFEAGSYARRPRYYYQARARYFSKYYGRAGLWQANILWHCGRSISAAREIFGGKQPHTCARESLDNWIGSLSAGRR